MTREAIISRLYGSFTELEQAIEHTKRTLAARSSIPIDIVLRLNSYDEILRKQRNLAEDLSAQIELGSWDQIRQTVELINGLSELIKEDATEILKSLNSADGEVEVEEDLERKYC